MLGVAKLKDGEAAYVIVYCGLNAKKELYHARMDVDGVGVDG